MFKSYKNIIIKHYSISSRPTAEIFLKMSLCTATLIFLAGGMSLALGQLVTAPADRMRCQALQEQECLRLGYNSTYLPNLRGHRTQLEAANEFKDFLPLVDRMCSNAILHFLCSFYFPVCFLNPSSNQVKRLNPCRRLCEYIESNCSKAFLESNFDWPSFFNCSLEDSFTVQQPCFGQENLSAVTIPERGLIGTTVKKDTTAAANKVTLSWWLVPLFATCLFCAHFNVKDLLL